MSARATEFEGLTVGGFTSGGLFQDGLIVWQVSAGSLQEASVLIFAGIFTALLDCLHCMATEQEFQET